MKIPTLHLIKVRNVSLGVQLTNSMSIRVCNGIYEWKTFRPAWSEEMGRQVCRLGYTAAMACLNDLRRNPPFLLTRTPLLGPREYNSRKI